jgi:general secretion pathway protein N
MRFRLAPQRSLPVLLGLLCLGLAVLASSELQDGQDASSVPAPPAPPAKAAAPGAAPAAFSLPPLQSFAVVTERPIFAPDRKPAQAASETAGAWSSFVLAGVIITPQSREALVLHGKPATVAHLQEGQALEGWTVTSIYPDRVVLRDGLDEHELRLVPKAPPPVVATHPRLPVE